MCQKTGGFTKLLRLRRYFPGFSGHGYFVANLGAELMFCGFGACFAGRILHGLLVCLVAYIYGLTIQGAISGMIYCALTYGAVQGLAKGILSTKVVCPQ